MRILILIIWLLLGIAYWFISKDCCVATTESESTVITTDAEESNASKKDAEKVITRHSPIRFAKSSALPLFDDRWNAFRDSLVRNMGKDSVLSVKGLYFKDEEYAGSENLGASRAKNVIELFDSTFQSRIELNSGLKGDSFDIDEQYNLAEFRYLRRTAQVKEIEDRTIIYFAFNSTRKLSNNEVETYLDDVAERVKKSGEKIRLIGHTDNIGDEKINLELSEQRAVVIKNYLIEKGVNPAKIMVSAEGEGSPIADNATQAGRDRNRRVELQII